MRAKEFTETIGTVPPGSGGTIQPTQPTMGGTPQQPQKPGAQAQKPGQVDPQMIMQLKSRINDLKPAIKTASGGQDFDTNQLAQALASGNTTGMPASGIKALKQALIPAVDNTLQSQQTTNALKTAFNAGNQATQKQQQLQKQQQAQQTSQQQSQQQAQQLGQPQPRI